MARYNPQISLGNIIQVGVLLVTIVGGWFNLSNRVEDNLGDINKVQAAQKELMVRTRSLELWQASGDQKLANILEIVKDNKVALERLSRSVPANR